MTKIKETLRSICFYKIECSIQSLDPEALDGQNTTILVHFSSFQILAHFFNFDYSLLKFE
jgi:hypothetical protein